MRTEPTRIRQLQDKERRFLPGPKSGVSAPEMR
jgi:hypothetical protein